MKLKNKSFLGRFKGVQNLLDNYPLTISTILLGATYNIILINLNPNVEFLGKLFNVLMLIVFGAFFTETLFSKKLNKTISFSINIVISSLLVFLGNDNIIQKYIIGYILILIVISIYYIIKKNNIEFNEYVLKFFSNIFYNLIIYLTLVLGFSLIGLVFAYLILENNYTLVLGNVNILLAWLALVPLTISACIDVDKETGNFVSKLVEYILIPLIAIVIGIIYIYMLKILILWQIPSNMIFRILSITFMFAFPIWNMAEVIKSKNKIIEKTTKILPYTYLPLILLEIYSLLARIINFGLTPIRYFGIAMLILQIAALILTFTKSKNLKNIFIVGAILTAIAFISPINYENASIWSQRNILKNNLPEGTNYSELSNETKNKIKSAYKYLSMADEENSIPQYIKEQKNEIFYWSLLNK